MNKKTYCLHRVIDQNLEHGTFSPEAYSKFKFGSKDIARDFGHDLAQGFINNFTRLYRLDANSQIVVISSPYCFIPTATFAMKDYFVDKLNDYLVRSGLKVVEETKIHRTITYKEDYGNLSADERMRLIGNDGFHIDKSFIEGKILIFMDDIKITGSHERVIERMCEQFGLTNECWFLYFAQLVNNNIHPRIENKLNYWYVKNLLDLDKIIKNENFLLNTRTVKYILASAPFECAVFLQYQKQTFLETLYHSAIGNSYHLIDDYKTNLDCLIELLETQYNY